MNIFEKLFGESTGDITKDIEITDVDLSHDCISISYIRKAYGFGSITVSTRKPATYDENFEKQTEPEFFLDTEHSDADHVVAVWKKALIYIVDHGKTDHNIDTEEPNG